MQKIFMHGFGFLNGMDFKIETGDSIDMFVPNMDFLDLPKECLEGDCLDEGNWDEKFQDLGPIHSEALMGPSEAFAGNNCHAASVLASTLSGPSEDSSAVFQSPCPDSVLKRVTSETPVGVPNRTKRSRSLTANVYKENFAPICSTFKRVHKFSKRKPEKKKKLLSELSNSSKGSLAMKRCSHCDIKETPQWREGPMGPNTLCNACGVRYRSGRLFPEYRPLASPTFVKSMHSNSHRKVIEMREKALHGAAAIEQNRHSNCLWNVIETNEKALQGVAIDTEDIKPIEMREKALHGAAAIEHNRHSNCLWNVIETNRKALQGVAIDTEDIKPPPSPPLESVPLSGYSFDCLLGSSWQHSFDESLFF